MGIRIKIAIGFFALLTWVSCGSRTEGSEDLETSKLNGQAQFPGGYQALQKFIHENLDWEEPKDTIESNLPVLLTIKANGEIGKVELVHPLCASCDSAAFRLVKRMPKWIPARKDGKDVESIELILIMFQSSSIK